MSGLGQYVNVFKIARSPQFSKNSKLPNGMEIPVLLQRTEYFMNNLIGVFHVVQDYSFKVQITKYIPMTPILGFNTQCVMISHQQSA